MTGVRELFESAVRDQGGLGDAAADRRASVPDLLWAVVDRRRRRRHAGRAVGVLVLVLVALAVAWPVGGGDTPSLPAERRRPTWIAIVSNTTGVVERHRAAPPDVSRIERVRSRPLSPAERLDDAGLVTWLRSAGRSAGVIRSGSLFALTEPIGE